MIALSETDYALEQRLEDGESQGPGMSRSAYR